MKKFILFFMIFLTLSAVTFASFPTTKDINAETIISNDYSEKSDPDSKLLGIILGVSLGIFGVLIAYAMDDDEMVKWAWKGFLWVVIITVVLLLMFVAAIGGMEIYY